MLSMCNSSFYESPLIFVHHIADLASLAFTGAKSSPVKTIDMEAFISKRLEDMTSITDMIPIARNIKDNGLSFSRWLHFKGCQGKLAIRVYVLYLKFEWLFREFGTSIYSHRSFNHCFLFCFACGRH